MALYGWPCQADPRGRLDLGTTADGTPAPDTHDHTAGRQAGLHGVQQHGAGPRAALMVLVACAVGFCRPVGVILFCYMKNSWTRCRTAWENPLSSRKGRYRWAWLLMLLVLGAVLVCFSTYHLNVMQFMARRLLRPPSCAQRRAFELSLQATMALMNMNCSFDPTIYFFASMYYRKWLLGILKLKASSSSSSPGKASSETPSVTQARGSVCLAEHVV
ncbi:G-protein coupled receptor 183-like [Callithrix jacchus]